MLAEVPVGWQPVRIGTLAEEVSVRNSDNKNMPVLSMTKHLGFVRSSEYFTKSVHSEDTSNYKVIRRGQFAYATIHLEEGSIDYLDNYEAGLISPMYTVFRIIHKAADPDFVFHSFKRYSVGGWFNPYSNGGVNRRKSISFGDLKAFKFALPPVEEQRAIVDTIAAVSGSIAHSECVVRNLKGLKDTSLELELSKLATVLPSDRLRRLHVVAEIRTGIAKSENRKISDPISVYYLRVANVQDGYLDLKELKSIMIGRDQLERYRLLDGDVLFNEGGDFDKLGRGCVWNGEITDCINQNHVFVVRCGPDLLPGFLALQAASRRGKAYFRLSSKQTTNLASINTSDLKSFPVMVPPLVEQARLTELANAFDARISKEKLAIAELKRLRGALIQELLSGRARLPQAMIDRYRTTAAKAA